MFSLIISIISIALVVALVAATMYYGGDTLNQGRSSADAATLVSSAQQITGAVQMHVALLGTQPADLTALTPDYLASLPSALGNAFDLNTGTRTLVAKVNSSEVCDLIHGDNAGVYDCAAATVANADASIAIGDFQFTYSY